jgi:hypothetical protein
MLGSNRNAGNGGNGRAVRYRPNGNGEPAGSEPAGVEPLAATLAAPEPAELAADQAEPAATVEAPPDPVALRARLAEVIEQLGAEQRRLAALESGQERAHTQAQEARSRHAAAGRALQLARREAPQRLAYAFIEGGDPAADDPAEAAGAEVAAAQAEIERLDAVETALDGEIGRVQASLHNLRTRHLTIVSDLVCQSPEYLGLVAAHRRAWFQLRSAKTALRAVSAAMHGYLPQSFMDEASLVEPIEPRIGYAVDTALVEGWQIALARLEIDAYAPLPRPNLRPV